jgi:hypothetical protein
MRKIPESRTIKNPLLARITSSRRYLAARAPDVDSTDPFAVWVLEPTAALDKRKSNEPTCVSALKFPSDVINKDSPKEERPRPTSSPNQWAYKKTLSGKREMDKTLHSSSGSSSKKG